MAGNTPVVLQKEFGDPRPWLDHFRLRINAESSHLTEKKRCEAIARIGRDRTGRRESGSENIGELKVPGRARSLSEKLDEAPSPRFSWQFET